MMIYMKDAKRDITIKKIEDIQKGEQSSVRDIPHSPRDEGNSMDKDLRKIQKSR
jgi:hypothetical protein